MYKVIDDREITRSNAVIQMVRDVQRENPEIQFPLCSRLVKDENCGYYIEVLSLNENSPSGSLFIPLYTEDAKVKYLVLTFFRT